MLVGFNRFGLQDDLAFGFRFNENLRLIGHKRGHFGFRFKVLESSRLFFGRLDRKGFRRAKNVDLLDLVGVGYILALDQEDVFLFNGAEGFPLGGQRVVRQIGEHQTQGLAKLSEFLVADIRLADQGAFKHGVEIRIHRFDPIR